MRKKGTFSKSRFGEKCCLLSEKNSHGVHMLVKWKSFKNRNMRGKERDREKER